MFLTIVGATKAILWTGSAITMVLGGLVLCYHGKEALEHFSIWDPLLLHLSVWWPFWTGIFIFVCFLRYICVQRPTDRGRRTREQARTERRARD